MVARQMVNLGNISFAYEIGLPRVIMYLNTYAEKQVWFKNSQY